MRFKKFKSKIARSNEAEAPKTTGHPDANSALSEVYLQSLRHFEEQNSIDNEDDGEEEVDADEDRIRTIFPPNSPVRRERIPDGYFDVNTAASLVGRPPQKIRDWIRNGRISSTRWGRRVLLKKDYFRNLMASWRNGKASPV